MQCLMRGITCEPIHTYVYVCVCVCVCVCALSDSGAAQSVIPIGLVNSFKEHNV